MENKERNEAINQKMDLPMDRKEITDATKLFYKELFDSFPELEKLEDDHRDKILRLIQGTRHGFYQHKLFPKDRIFSFHVGKVLRKIHSRNWNNMISPFFRKKVSCADYRNEHTTDGWAYTDRMERFLKRHSETVISNPDTTENIRRDIAINFDQSIKFLKFIIDCIKRKDYRQYNEIIKPKKILRSVNELIIKRDILVYILENSITKNYEECNTKRLIMRSDANLQACPSDIRKVILSGLGKSAFDIENCHFSIIWQLLDKERHIDIDETAIEFWIPKEYDFSQVYKLVSNPNVYKTLLADEWCITVPKAKEILTSLVNGGAQSYRSKCFKNLCAPFPENDRFLQELILNSNRFNYLKKEMKIIKEELYYKYRRYKNYSGISKRLFTSYLVQFKERKILDVVIKEYDPDLHIYDEWILNDDISEMVLIDLIKKETRFNIRLKKENLNFKL